MNTAMIQHRFSPAIWASGSLLLHALAFFTFYWWQSEAVPPQIQDIARIRIFSNSSASPASSVLAPKAILPVSPHIIIKKPLILKTSSPIGRTVSEQLNKPESAALAPGAILSAPPLANVNLPKEAPTSYGDDTEGGVVGRGFSTTDDDEFDASSTTSLQPLKRVEPVYPQEAALNGTEGWVTFTIDITETGDVQNIKLVESYPNRVFERESRRALSRWKYQPQLHNGKTMRVENHSVKIVFQLDH